MATVSIETTVTSDHRVDLKLPSDFPEGLVKVTIESVPVAKEDALPPRTELGRQLLEIRQQAIAAGMKTLNWEEVNEEVRRRRGGLSDE